jgi:hypothetical protein
LFPIFVFALRAAGAKNTCFCGVLGHRQIVPSGVARRICRFSMFPPGPMSVFLEEDEVFWHELFPIGALE